MSNKYWVRARVFAKESAFEDRVWRVLHQVPHRFNVIASITDFANKLSLIGGANLPVCFTFAFLGIPPSYPFWIGFEFGHQVCGSNGFAFRHRVLGWRTLNMTFGAHSV
ncbi:MAG: hypothetical protein ACQESR_28315 [Planctomycetota bacterium]